MTEDRPPASSPRVHPAASSATNETDIVVLGAGPIGLDAALALAEADRDFLLLEAGPRTASGVRSWGPVELFSPWEINLSARMQRALQTEMDDLDLAACPSGDDLCNHALDPVARDPRIAPRLRLGHRVVAVGREHLLKPEEIGTPHRAAQRFRLLVETPGGEQVLFARAVLDCTGSGHQPNWLGASGIPAPGERALDTGARSSSQPPLLVRTLANFLEVTEAAWNDREVLLVGGGHSAQTAAVQLAATGARLHWALRSDGRAIAPLEGDPLPQRAALHAASRRLLDGENPRVESLTGVQVDRLERVGEQVRVTFERHGATSDPTPTILDVDSVVALVGSRGDQALYRELQVQECYATAGPMRLAAALLGEADPDNAADCMEQTGQGPETLVTPEPGYFILGSKSYGRNSAFLLRIGYQQVDDVLTLIG